MAYSKISDKDFDWKGLADCEDILYRYCYTYGRFGGQIKEKYGTLRFYAQLNSPSLHSLVYPGYVYKRKSFPNWLWSADIYYISPFIQKVLGRPLRWWQSKVYDFAYRKCLKKYPHLARAILCSADFPELIKGATRKEETETETITVIQWNGKDLGKWVTSK